MRKLLLQLDSSRLPSVFDQVVAYDAGADEIMSYGGVTESDVRDLIHGCIFTRGPKDLHNTAVWIGGSNMSAGEQLLAMAQDALFEPFTVSLMLDSNGSNTTAVAAVVKIEETLGDLAGKKVLILAGTGPVGQRAAGLLAKDGAHVTITSREAGAGREGAAVHQRPVQRAGRGDHHERPLQAPGAVQGHRGAAQLRARRRADGAEVGVDRREEPEDRGGPQCGAAARHRRDRGERRRRHPRTAWSCYGAFGVGNFKTKLHKACVARLFTRNDLVLDAEAIADVARELVAKK